MAASSPSAVAMSASLMPGATTASPAEPFAPISRNEFIMPHTVPKSPMNGVVLAVVARKVSIRSSLPTCSFAARLSARSTLSTPVISEVRTLESSSPSRERVFSTCSAS